MLLKLTNNLKLIFNHCHQIFKIVHQASEMVRLVKALAMQAWWPQFNT